MPSIRKNLFIWLLLGLSLLWAIAGVVIYLSVRQGEIAKIDSELQRMEGALRFIGGSSFRNPGPQRPDHLIVRPPRENFQTIENRTTPENRIAQRWPDFLSEEGPKYILWASKDTVIRQSEGLPTKEFKFPEISDSNSPIFFNISLKNGDTMRAMASKLRRGGFGRPRPRGNEGIRRPINEPLPQNQEQGPPRNFELTGIIALSSKPMQQTLNTLLFGIIAVGIIAGFCSFSLVHFALKKGLKPLYALGNRLATVDSSS